MKYINLHTHLHSEEDNTVEVKNLFLHSTDKIPEKGLFSVGLHPWHLSQMTNTLQAELQKMEGLIIHPRVLMIGECGLDRLCDTTVDEQMPVFIEQLILAEKYKKPVVIHCVKAYNEIISLRKKLKLTIPFIFHGYTGNFETTEQLLKHDSYFSFGRHLLSGKILQKVFHTIPLKKVFLETDNADIPIETIYEFAADIYQTSVHRMKNIVNRNFTDLFY